MNEGKHAFGSGGRVNDSGVPSRLLLLQARP